MQPAQRRNFGLMCPGLALLRARVGINSAHLLHSSSICSALIEQPRIGPAAVALLSSRSSDLLPQAPGKRCRRNARTELYGSDFRVKEASIRCAAA